MSAEVAAVLDRAAEVIEERGWHQGWYMAEEKAPETCAVCMLGALNIAAGGKPDDVDGAAWDVSLNAQGALFQLLGMHPPQWNDTPGRTAPQVIAALRNAAAAERAS